jgi:dTMP kinase
MSERGKYIIIEGPDGTGKTTQAQLLTDTFNERGLKSRYVHEPGETPIGLELERLIKDRTLGRDSLTDLLLFTANRVEVWNQVIEPSLENGENIIGDRNWLSSVAFQGVAGGLGIAAVRDLTTRYLPDEYLYPTFTALLHVNDSQKETMLAKRGTSGGDYFETKPDEFLRKIDQGYEEAGRLAAATRHRKNGNQVLSSAYISANGTIQEVHERIVAKLEQHNIL